jgi:hypothetical protein
MKALSRMCPVLRQVLASRCNVSGCTRISSALRCPISAALPRLTEVSISEPGAPVRRGGEYGQ